MCVLMCKVRCIVRCIVQLSAARSASAGRISGLKSITATTSLSRSELSEAEMLGAWGACQSVRSNTFKSNWKTIDPFTRMDR
jgi:hypothetical protein